MNPSQILAAAYATDGLFVVNNDIIRFANAIIDYGGYGFEFKGAYNAGTAYIPYDVVEYNGSAYLCILASTGNLPTNTTYFSLFVSKGTDGTNGATWTRGTGVPTGGNSGDLYLRTTNSDVYLNTAGSWAVITNIKGATGATGASGVTTAIPLSGKYISPVTCIGAYSGNTAPALNRVHAYPILIGRSFTTKAIGIHCFVTSGSGYARIGIYSESGNCTPSSLLLDLGALGAITSNTSVFSQIAISGAGFTFSANTVYWIIVVSDGTLQIPSLPANAFFNPILGCDTGTSPAKVLNISCLIQSVSGSFAALPSTLPTTVGSWTALSFVNCPSAPLIKVE